MKKLFLVMVLILSGSLCAFSQTETIVDNADANTSVVGSWDTGTWTNYGDIYPWGQEGADKRYSSVTAAGDKEFTWTANLAEGDYEISFCVNRGGYVNLAHYTIWSNGGSTNVQVTASQYSTGGAAWVDLLADYGQKVYCNGETRITLNNSSAGVTNGSIVVADAVRFYGPFASLASPTPTDTPVPLPTVTPGIGDIYIESRSDGKNFNSYAENGVWADTDSKSTAEGLTAEGSRYMSMSFPSRRAKFYLPTPQAGGEYDVYVTYPQGTANGRWWVNSVSGLVGGVTDSINQSQDPNTWVNLGRYQLQPGFGYVEIGGTGDDTQTSINFYADAVKFTGPYILPTPVSFVEEKGWIGYE